jgi:hypothetical protein
MTSLSEVSKEDRWPIYRRPRKHFFLPADTRKITHISLPTAKHSSQSELIPIDRKDELFEVIFKHYDSLLPESEKFGNFCGEHIGTRRHEVLDCDPFFGGFKVVGTTAYLIVHDARFQSSWSLAPEE